MCSIELIGSVQSSCFSVDASNGQFFSDERSVIKSADSRTGSLSDPCSGELIRFIFKQIILIGLMSRSCHKGYPKFILFIEQKSETGSKCFDHTAF